jgi:ATP-dependent protease ClpP protease subunit
MRLLFILFVLFFGVARAEPEKQTFPRTVLEGIETPQLGDIGLFYPIEESEFYIFNSKGGIIDTAFAVGDRLKGKTCIIEYAASAALQILLPYCTHRYYLPTVKITFHSAHSVMQVFGSFTINMWDAEEIFNNLKAENLRMVRHMHGSGFPMTP